MQLKKDLNEITKDIVEIIEEQFFIIREEDSFKQTISDIVNVMLDALSFSLINITEPQTRSKLSEEIFPQLCDALEKKLQGTIEILE